MFQTLCVTLNRTVKFVTFNICLINHSSTSSKRHQKKNALEEDQKHFFSDFTKLESHKMLST